MQKIIPVEHGRYYHIYNRGINKTLLFYEESNYYEFMELYEKYVLAIADTFCWCLLPNHFHFLVRIKEAEEIKGNTTLTGSTTNDTLTGSKDPVRVGIPSPSQQFSNLFNAYAQKINRQWARTGGLFQRPFKRKVVETEEYAKHLIYYIHHNPVHHKYRDKFEDYKWSSYKAILSKDKTNLMREDVLEWFDDIENFIFFHQQRHEIDLIKDLIIED